MFKHIIEISVEQLEWDSTDLNFQVNQVLLCWMVRILWKQTNKQTNKLLLKYTHTISKLKKVKKIKKEKHRGTKAAPKLFNSKWKLAWVSVHLPSWSRLRARLSPLDRWTDRCNLNSEWAPTRNISVKIHLSILTQQWNTPHDIGRQWNPTQFL